jgi:hypothetical protein
MSELAIPPAPFLYMFTTRTNEFIDWILQSHESCERIRTEYGITLTDEQMRVPGAIKSAIDQKLADSSVE